MLAVQSMFMVTTQPKLIVNSRAIKCQRIEEFVWPILCFAIKQAVKLSKGKKFCLPYSVVHIASKQAIKLPGVEDYTWHI